MWVSSDRRRSALLNRAEAVLWQTALPFQSPDALLAAAVERQRMPRAVAEAAMLRLRELDLVVTARDWLRPADAAPFDADIVIAVRTYRRPAALRRLLASALAGPRDGASARTWLVIDDARDEADAADNRAVVRDAARDGLDVRYLGPRERAELIASLGTGDAAAYELLDPGVRATASGARSWNWAMLLTAGAAVSMIDDDCVLPVCRPESWQRVWSMQDTSAFEGRFYDEAVPELPQLDGDPWTEAAQVIGQSPGTLAARDGIAVHQIAGKTLEQLASWQPERRVGAVIAGIHGGHVFNSGIYLSIADVHTLRDLLRPPFSLSRLQGDRLWQGVTVPRLCSSATYTPFLIDNRQFLPFATSAAHADDTAFLGLWSAIAPETDFAMLPMLVGHAPVESRDRLAAITRALLMDGNAWLSGFARQWMANGTSGDRVARWRALSASAAEAAARDADGWRDDLTVWRNRVIAGALDALTQSLHMAGDTASPAWRDTLHQAMTVNTEAMSSPAPDALLAQAQLACDQLARHAESWTGWWHRAADGWRGQWLERLRVRG